MEGRKAARLRSERMDELRECEYARDECEARDGAGM